MSDALREAVMGFVALGVMCTFGGVVIAVAAWFGVGRWTE